MDINDYFIKKGQVCLILICGLLANGVLKGQTNTNSYIKNPLPLMLTLDFEGPETMTWYRVGLATTGKSEDLHHWIAAYDYVSQACLSATISESDARRLLNVLRQDKWVKLRSAYKERDFSQHYVITVYEGSEQYHISIGFKATSRNALVELESALDDKSGAPLKKVIDQLSVFE